MIKQVTSNGKYPNRDDLIMNDSMIQDGGTLAISDSDRIRLSAAWEVLLVKIQGDLISEYGQATGEPLYVYESTSRLIKGYRNRAGVVARFRKGK